CQENVNAADPYIKDAYPKGYSDPHYIQANTDIDYIIRFQNTGLDTAHNILIVDTLSPHLDIASIRHGTSSHPYHMELEGDNVLRFSFDNIMLPDSSTNESASHGFVKFRIAQKPDTPSGTYLENAANIYFDYEAPAQTDTAWHNIAQDYMASNCLLSFHSQNDLTQFANSVLASPNMGCSLLIKTESDNDPITQLDALDVLTHIKGFVRIEQNDELQNLTGLHHIFLVDSFFNIGQNNSLTDLSGLENLNAIGGHLSIENNAALTSLHGLEQLTSISQRFDLHGNPYLSELSALENLYPDTLSELYVYLNDMLSTCTVPIICEYMHLVDSLYIASNASGCHTVDAVDMNCTVGIKPFNKDKLQVFPNPTDGTVRIVSPLSESVLLEVKDVSGKLLLQKGFTTETEINLSAFASGVYILMIQTKDTIWIERVVAN
ncbi:MAG TPA: T9SS type A sorting domain-containing protein, partial [Phaeodactylibacter sp.]|nr:T9SS type A sorting domain-containing protein [Phaeodactylibacter sp.]